MWGVGRLNPLPPSRSPLTPEPSAPDALRSFLLSSSSALRSTAQETSALLALLRLWLSWMVNFLHWVERDELNGCGELCDLDSDQGIWRVGKRGVALPGVEGCFEGIEE